MAMTLSQLASKLAAASKLVTPESHKKLETMAEVGVGIMKRWIQDYHAVDTGTMLNHTDKERKGFKAYLIGPDVDYAPFVALGTSRMAARPFHIKAAEELQGELDRLGFTAKGIGL